MKLILAPLANLSHSGLRRLIHRFADPDEYFTEMIHAPSLLSGGQFEQWYLRANPVPEKLVWQLTSHKAEAFIQALPIVLRHGGIGIDLNMGCCAPPIVQSGAGFAWMLKPLEQTAQMVGSVKAALDAYSAAQGRRVRLSVKLRLGTAADYAFIVRFCRMLESEGVQLITLHPRLQRQSYSRPALHEYTARLAADLNIPVYGNGDIDSPEKLRKLCGSIPCAGWMVGRAAVQKPWIFRLLNAAAVQDTGEPDACQPSSTEAAPYRIDLEETALLFLEWLKEEQPAAFHLTRAQRFFQFYCDNFSFAHHCKTRLLRAGSPDEMKEILHTYFEQVPEDRILTL
ncbi:MAG: tRNA-dihydrouridine synthase family protein [Treponema sp.]